jgi:hypothetical protein
MWHGWCSNYLPILTSNTTDATSRPEITYPSLPSEFDLGCSCTFCPYTCRHVSIQCCAFASGAPVFISVFGGVHVTRSFFFFCVCRLFFVLLHFLFWPLCCLFFFDLRILITPLVSSNSSCDVCYDIRVHPCSVRLCSRLFCRGGILYLCYLYLFTYTDIHIRWCSCR